MTRHDEIGFNNFKSFGDKLQTFSKKPLTIVFGPNSIGKSSILHFLLLIEYIKQSGELDLNKSYFAGDSIDLGGYANYVHKKEIDKNITYQLIFTNAKDIGKYFSPLYIEAKKFDQAGIFKEKIERSTIRKRLSLFEQKQEGQNPTFTATKRMAEWMKNNIYVSEKERDRLLKKFYSIHDENEKFLNELIIKSDNSDFDEIDNFIVHLLDYKKINIFKNNIDVEKVIDDIMKLWKFYERINEIYKISIEFKFQYAPKKSYICKYLIDNELIYTYDSSQKKVEINHNSELLIQFNSSGFVKDYGYPDTDKILFDLLTPEFTFRIFAKSTRSEIFHWDSKYFTRGNSFNTLAYSINDKVCAELKKIYNIQYLGPLRYFPQRADLREDLTITAEDDKCHETRPDRLFAAYLKFSHYIPSSIGKTGFTKLFFLINAIKVTKILFDSNFIRDCLNYFKSSKNKVSSGNSLNSRQIWASFIKDSTAHRLLNDWLSDETKLKTSYNFRIKKTERNNVFSKVFGSKPTVTQELVFVDKRTGTEVTPREMGLGISQILPVLITSMSLSNNRIFIEQPELHLHPAVQCELADVFIRSMNRRGNEFILESHSEHLLLRVMKRMRQTAEGTLAKDDELALTPDEVCLLYVDHNGQFTHLNELELDNDGSLLDPWPNGFFEEGFKERFS